jgi:hypothetical protein
MGRKPKPTGESSSTVGFKAKKPETVDILKTIAKREGVLLKEIYNRAIEEYAERHGPGNFQTLIGSYQPGGLKSDGQLEVVIVNELMVKFTDKEVRFIEISRRCRDHGFKKDIPATADRIAQELHKRGWKVWR